jgi:hypothetical protein
VGDVRARIFIGYDPRERVAFDVAAATMRAGLSPGIRVEALMLSELRERGLYTRPTEVRDGRLWDVISGAPMSTEFAISRFLVPHLAKAGGGLAMFADCDVMVRKGYDLAALFAQLDPAFAIHVVKHEHRPSAAEKMDGQLQTTYARKNWSSVMVFNLDHPATATLTPEVVNTLPGRDLHRLCWLDDSEIGELPVAFNWLAGHSPADVDPIIVHFTDGIPTMRGYENAPYADEWRAARDSRRGFV